MATAWATDNADVDVYIDYPDGAWADWSWATHNDSSTTYVHSYQYAMQVSFTPYTAIWLHNQSAGTPATGFTNLEFWINGGANSGQFFGVSVGVNFSGTGNPYGLQSPIAITNFVTVTAGQWKLVDIPLGKLGVTNGAVLTDVYLAEIRSNTIASFWIDDMKLTKAAPTNAPAIQIDAGQPLQTVSPRAFGLNTAAWDSDLNIPGTTTLLAQGGYTALRFPGGSLADEYNWASNSDINPANAGVQATDTAGFLQAAQAAGVLSNCLITVNYGSGSALEASNWVVYANQTLGGNVFYWTIGNECYGSWEYDTNPVKQDAATYATFTRAARQAMKAADARIKVGVVGLWDETSYPQRFKVTNPRTGITTNGWSAVLLSKLAGLGVTPDFYEIHNYPIPNGSEDDSALLQAPPTWGPILAATRQMLSDYLGTNGLSVPILITENNDVPTNPGKQITSLVNGLFLADSWAQALLAGADAFVWWDLHNWEDNSQNNSPTLYGWRLYGDYGVLAAGNLAPLNQPFPAYYTAKILKSFARPGDTLVSATSNTELLHSYANLAADGSLRLLVINEAVSNNATATIALAGFIPTNTTAAAVRYGKPEDLAAADLTQTNFTNTATTFTATFPAYSMTVVTITGLKAITFAEWRAANFSAANATNDAISGPDADPDQDGVPNLLEYALNLNPQVAGTSGLPVGMVQHNADGNDYLTLTYTRVKAATDISYFVEGTGSLPGSWTTNSVVQVDQLVDQGSTQLITARDTVPIATAASRFLRLHVSQP